MKLQIITPLAIIFDEDVDSLCAEDASGSFGILSGHAPFLTALMISIVSWRKSDTQQFCAIRGGVMTVSGRTEIAITTREAVVGNDLATLDVDVLARFQADVDEEKVEHVETARMQLHAIRCMITRLREGAPMEGFQ
jgi:F-type H+-transporting ATPase subunit epsilon